MAVSLAVSLSAVSLAAVSSVQASIQSLFLLLCSGLFDHDCPDESQQFPRDRGHDDIRVFAVVAQLAKATAKPHLRLPGDRLDWGRRLLGTALNQPRAACREAIRPGAFDQQTASFLVACFGDRALTASRSARVLRRSHTPTKPISSRGESKRVRSPSSASNVIPASQSTPRSAVNACAGPPRLQPSS